MSVLVAKAILWIVAAFYAYGAAVHLMNILGMSGFDWVRAPQKWQILDVVYLILDVVVAVGLVFGWRAGYVAFFVAALSQILLYKAFRAWIIDVPDEFARTPEQIQQLDGLVVFHLVTAVLVILAIWLLRSASPATPA